MRWMLGIAALIAASSLGCEGEVSIVRGDAGHAARDAASVPDAPAPGPAVVAIEAPGDGARVVRDRLAGGAWVARIEVVIRASGVDHVDVFTGGTTRLASLRAPAWTTFLTLDADGEHVITAIGRDAEGGERARDEVTITVTAPADESCHAMLDALGLDWEPIEALRGVADPVRVQPIIAGVVYRPASRDQPVPLTMDCELAPRLVRLSELVRGYGVDEIEHLGTYNYRCIGGGDPDSGSCNPSQHAYGRAIDLHAFGREGSDETYSTETDFVITRRSDDCPMMSSSEPDRVLKEIACALWSEGIFQIVLTPNYNDAHRNHYHVDLTEGSMFLGSSASGVDPAIGGLGD